MTNEKVAAFYREIGEVCAKHNIGGLIGMWLAGRSDDSYGFIRYYDPTDTDMSRVSQLIMDQVISNADSIYKGETLGNIREIHSSEKGKENN